MAGVSKSSASRILNGQATHIPAETRGRVETAAAALRYRPNQWSKYLRARSRRAVSVIGPLCDTGKAPFLRALTRFLSADGYTTQFVDSGPDPRVEVEALRQVAGDHPDAIVLVGSRPPEWPSLRELEMLHEAGFPSVTVYHRIENSVVPYVTLDHERLGEMAAAHLAEQDCRRIAWLAAPHHGFKRCNASTPQRLAGFVRALRKHGLRVDERRVLNFGKSSATAMDAAIARLLDGEQPDGVVATNIELGQRTVRIAQELGLRVPDDLAVVGIGNSHMVELAYPVLTTVGLATPFASAVALRRILRTLFEDPRAWDRKGIVVPTKLHLGASSVRRPMRTFVAPVVSASARST